jgi:hypothetical protein
MSCVAVFSHCVAVSHCVRARHLSLVPHISVYRGVLHRSACEGYRPATTRMVSLNTRPSPRPSPADAGEGADRGVPHLPHQREVRVQPSNQPRWAVQGPPPHANGAVKYASVYRDMRQQAKVALFEPRGELLRKHGRGTGSSHALVTPRWVFRCFLCPLSLHQQRKWVAGRGEFPAGSHAVRKHKTKRRQQAARAVPPPTGAGAPQ